MNKYRGPRDGCQDIFCPFKECGYDKKCMDDCISEKSNSITECCINQCPVGNAECFEACSAGRFRQLQTHSMERTIEIDWIITILLITAAVLLF